MERNNVEQQIKEKLHARTIQPSSQAWERLDSMLTVAENKKAKRHYNWLYVAASFLGFILIGTLFFNLNGKLSDVEQSVVTQDKAIEESREMPIVEKTAGTGVMQTISEVVLVSESNKTIRNTKQPKTRKEEVFYALSHHQKLKENTIINQETEQKINLSKSNDANSDQLLVIVDQTSETVNSIKKSTVKVNASYLLSQVDQELELSFREKVIKSVGKNFKTVKESLVSRNQEEQSY